MRDAYKSVQEFHDKHGFMFNGDLFDQQMDSVVRKSMNVISDMLLQAAKTIEAIAIFGRDHGDERLYRVFLTIEEVGEMIKGLANRDLQEVADGLGDSLYVLLGTAVAYGINISAVFDEIHASNMTKPMRTKEDPRMRQKVGEYRPPRVTHVLEHSKICFMCEVPTMDCIEMSDEDEEHVGFVCPRCNKLLDKLDDIERIDSDENV